MFVPLVVVPGPRRPLAGGAPEARLTRAARQGRTSVPIHVVVTDHDSHRLWWYPEIEAYYVASDVVKARLVYRYQVPPDRIAVIGEN